MNEKTELILANILRYLPANWVSDIGAHFGRKEVMADLAKGEPWLDNFYESVEHLMGVSDLQEKKRLLAKFGEQVGRVYAETTVLQKIDRNRQIDIVGLERLEGVKEPFILIGPHISNWEVLLKLSRLLNNPICLLYEPRETPTRMKIVNRSRRDWGPQINLMSSREPFAMKKILKLIQSGYSLFILIDEEKNGYVHAPSLGRSIPYAGNRWLVSKLAAKLSLDIIPAYAKRVSKTNFLISIEERISPNPQLDPENCAKEIADKMDNVLDIWVRNNLLDWYWLPYLDIHKQPPKSSSVN